MIWKPLNGGCHGRLWAAAQQEKKIHLKYTDSIIFVIHAYEEQEELRKRGEFGHMGQKNTLTHLVFIDHEPGRTQLNKPRAQHMLACR